MINIPLGIFELHRKFEAEVFKVFPAEPIPEFPAYKSCRTQLEQDACRVFPGKRWYELIGHRLRQGELDNSPSALIATFPVELVCYYLPAHLLFGSFGLHFQANHSIDLVEAFFLPPVENVNELEEIDEEMAAEASVAIYGESRKRLFDSLTVAQRRCVGLYLMLFERYEPDWYQGNAKLIFQKNKLIWIEGVHCF